MGKSIQSTAFFQHLFHNLNSDFKHFCLPSSALSTRCPMPTALHNPQSAFRNPQSKASALCHLSSDL